MGMELVGRLQALWRYPVKSRLGERLKRLSRRVRSNLLIEPAPGFEGFVEERWEGGTLAIGEQLILRVEGGCSRCVITTLPQGQLPQELEILRATAPA